MQPHTCEKYPRYYVAHAMEGEDGTSDGEGNGPHSGVVDDAPGGRGRNTEGGWMVGGECLCQ